MSSPVCGVDERRRLQEAKSYVVEELRDDMQCLLE